MNRHDRRKMIAEARKEFPLLDLRPGRILTPVPGTIDWAPDGQPRGVWGKDKPICYMQHCDDGSVRQLTRAETRLFEHIYGRLDWPIGNR